MPDFGTPDFRPGPNRPESGPEPSFDEIRRSDGFIDALATGRPVAPQDQADAALAALLGGWRDEVRRPPAPGLITSYDEPAGPGVRVDSGVEAGSEVTPMYDPMVAKLIVWDNDREKATARMLRALDEYRIGGLSTLIPFHKALLSTEQWRKGETCRDLMEDKEWLKTTAPEPSPGPDAGDESPEKVSRDYTVEVSGRRFDVTVIGEASGPVVAAGSAAGNGAGAPPKRKERTGGGGGSSSADLPSPLQGSVFKVEVTEGAEVSEGDLICVIEAMKMENEITAHRSGKVTSLPVSVGDAVAPGDTLVTIE